MTKDAFQLELDHIFVFVAPQAPETKVLKEAGLQWSGQKVKHAGQGTASTVFFFENIYLELLWIEDPELASETLGKSIQGRSQWRENHTSPFGIGLRCQPNGQIPASILTRKHHADWMKPDTNIEIITTSDRVASEPYYFIVPEYMSFANPRRKPPDFKHALGIRRVTKVSLTLNQTDELTSTSRLLSQQGVFDVETGSTPKLELVFDHGSSQQTIDLQPDFPLIFKY